MLVLPLWELPRIFTVRTIVTAVDAIRPKDFYFHGEIHDFWEIVYIAEGSAGITADERAFILNEGQLVFHKPMEFHRIWSVNHKPFRIFLLTFTADGDAMNFFRNKVLKLENEQANQFHNILKKAIFLLEGWEQQNDIDGQNIPVGSIGNEMPFSERHSAHTIAASLELLLLSLMEAEHDDVHFQTPKSSETYKKIVRMMEQHCSDALTLSQLADLCGLSISGLKKVFRKFSDKSVMAYMTSLKIRYAMQWLKEGVSAVEISDRLGYSNPNYFYVVFKRETGMTPKEFRNSRHLL